jgi:hypothetical protein
VGRRWAWTGAVLERVKDTRAVVCERGYGRGNQQQ